MDRLCNDAVGSKVESMSYIDQSLPMALKVKVRQRIILTMLCSRSVASAVVHGFHFHGFHSVQEAMLPVVQRHGSKLDISVADEEFLPFPDAAFDRVFLYVFCKPQLRGNCGSDQNMFVVHAKKYTNDHSVNVRFYTSADLLPVSRSR